MTFPPIHQDRAQLPRRLAGNPVDRPENLPWRIRTQHRGGFGHSVEITERQAVVQGILSSSSVVIADEFVCL
jgi:hypothetical protein